MYFVLKTQTFAKLFILISCGGLFMYAMLAFYTFHTAYSSMSQFQSSEDNIPGLTISDYKKKLQKYRTDLKYVLIWTVSNDTITIEEGLKLFIDYNCPYTNCYLTTNKFLLNEDYTNFEAIIFDMSFIKVWEKKLFPLARSSHQKYIFRSTISSNDAPVCNIFTDNYFNWTWTYRLDSDILAPFIEVKNLDGNAVAPRRDVTWESNMTLLSEKEMMHLKYKKKAVAWIGTKCETKNNRLVTAKIMQRMFRANSLVFDIFGCGEQNCLNEDCLKAVERDYYFYYAPEDSSTIDYVTKEVVIGYTHYAVPIVVGGADYRKFIPEGSYINVGSKSIDRLAALVEYTIKNPKIYYSFHRWRKHYDISEADKFKGICEVCEYLNDEDKFSYISVKEDFRKWWYSRPLYQRCIPKGAESFSEVLSYVNESRHYLTL